MIAKYKTLYFNAKFEDDSDMRKVLLWNYRKPSFLKGFSESYDDDCLLCYCKTVDVNQVDRLFIVGFSVIWHKLEFKAEYLPSSGKIRLFTESEQLSHEFEFKQSSGTSLYNRIIDMSEIADYDFLVSEYNYLNKKTQIIKCDSEEWIGEWRLYVSNLSYGKRKDKELVKLFV